MTELENQSTGPRTEEGKQRSSQNSLKHGLFARTLLIAGESQEEYDRHLYRYQREHNPKTPTEEDLVRHLAQTEWRRRRIPVLEADAIGQSLESGDAGRAFMNTYSIYDQRFNRMIQSTLKTLADLQARRKKQTALQFRIACIIHNYKKKQNIPWNPADNGFVFSAGLIDRQASLADAIKEANDTNRVFATDTEIDAFIAQDIM
jgi:hypothetical protein